MRGKAGVVKVSSTAGTWTILDLIMAAISPHHTATRSNVPRHAGRLYFQGVNIGRLATVWGPVLAMACVRSTPISDQAPASSPRRDARPNVLLIAVDDLNTWVEPLGGHPQVQTPHLRRLARRGVTFTNAFSPAPLCTPSRAAALTGMSPRSLGMTGRAGDWSRYPSVPTLPRFFKDQGYYVAGAGKIYHERYHRAEDFSEYYAEREHEPTPPLRREEFDPIFFAPLDAPDESMRDYDSLRWVVSRLQQPRERPFLIAWGLHKPHLPWEVPRAYFDRYPLEGLALPPTRDDDLDDVPPAGVALAGGGELHARILGSGRWQEAVRGYLAAVSFMDAMTGHLLDALLAGPYADNTIIVFWSDNGWHLGEKQTWRKFTLWNESTHVPLIIVAPGLGKAGGRCARPVDHTALYATVVELAGLPVPRHVEALSLRALLRDPLAVRPRPAVMSYLGHDSVRTENWRYIRYADGGEELYDEERDPHEWHNLAARRDLDEVKQDLAQWIRRPPAPAAVREPASH
jgi:arylsulfatase A-like enzyme